MLKIKNAYKSYGKQHVLNGVSLSIKKNEIIGLAGPSGGGKSTLLRCIQKLEVFDSGDFICDEVPGFMFQDFQLFPHMSVWDNLIYATQFDSKHNAPHKYATNLLNKLGLTKQRDKYPHELSGGQKQRVALARSLMLHPSLLLCDEPTSGLDVATISGVIELLHGVRDMGITMIMASHDLDFLTKLADRVIVLQGGKIVAEVDPKSKDYSLDLLKRFECD